ncbi:hypothetical protein AGMMS50222_09440 [Endomicrobiia bacterium]|nr:hypothetical protein AGMMS49556_09910 [Endomicrobiia bacterium]GHT76613.1 hypothetical protein AGMMS50222_09440 [Endomicrobiia bacterium]
MPTAYKALGCQNKKVFMIYKEWKKVFDTLNDTDSGKLIKALFAYDGGQDYQTVLNGIKKYPLKLYFISMSKDVDFEKAKALKVYERNVKSTLKRDAKKKAKLANFQGSVLAGTL